TFTAGMTFPEGFRNVASADLNGDRLLDLVIIAGDLVEVHLGNGDGTFQDGLITNVYAGDVAFGDLNGDGKVDMVPPSYLLRFFSVLLGKGDGTFQPAIDYATGPNPFAVSIADFDKDGRLDVAVASTIGIGVSVLHGKGDGTLQPYFG